MATKTRAAQVSARELSTMVDKAVAIAAKRHEVALGSEKNVIVNWELVGRILKQGALADKFANEVTTELAKQGLKFQAGTMTLGKKIIYAGFWERPPVLREF
jgi:hypothetical protein